MRDRELERGRAVEDTNQLELESNPNAQGKPQKIFFQRPWDWGGGDKGRAIQKKNNFF